MTFVTPFSISPKEIKCGCFQLVALEVADAHPGIDSQPGVCGGSACIIHPRIPVWLLEALRRNGHSEAELLADYPSLTAEDLANAWNYARSHREEMDHEIAALRGFGHDLLTSLDAGKANEAIPDDESPTLRQRRPTRRDHLQPPGLYQPSPPPPGSRRHHRLHRGHGFPGSHRPHPRPTPSHGLTPRAVTQDQHLLLDPLSLDVLDGKFIDGDIIIADVTGNEITFTK